jgi:electron transfer flavoprotein alpha subunit
MAKIVRDLVAARGYTNVLAAATMFGKDVIPRVGGLIDSQPIGDVIEIEDGGSKFKRPIYAGNAIATVTSSDATKLLTVRPTNFEKVVADQQNTYPTEDVSSDLTTVKGTFVKNIVSKSERADLSSSKFVVSGGRGLKNGENFEMLYKLAEELGSGNCAVGASRAAVDAGYVPNDMQVG